MGVEKIPTDQFKRIQKKMSIIRRTFYLNKTQAYSYPKYGLDIHKTFVLHFPFAAGKKYKLIPSLNTKNISSITTQGFIARFESTEIETEIHQKNIFIFLYVLY